MRKLLLGCGIAAALVVALLIAGGVIVGSWFKQHFPAAAQFERERKEIVQKYGRPEVYVPPLGGVPEAARLEAFVALRDSLVEHRDTAAMRLGSFVRRAERERPAGRSVTTRIIDAVGMTEGGASMVSGILDYMGWRTRMQFASDMGEGEYDYLYALTTFGYLQWDPLGASSDSSEAARDFRRNIVAQKYELQTIFELQLANLQKALEQESSRTPDHEALLAALRTELPSAREKSAFPFAGTLPPHVRAALAPYESRLRADLPKTVNGAFLDVLQVSERESGVRFRWGEDHRPRKGVRVE